jgi:hypothetical protein
MSVCCERCVLSGRGLCDELIIRPEESYGRLCFAVCCKNLAIEKALAYCVLLRQKKKEKASFSTKMPTWIALKTNPRFRGCGAELNSLNQ